VTKMATNDELKRAVVRMRNTVDPGWHLRARKRRHQQAGEKMAALQDRLFVANQLGLPVPEVSQEFADGFIAKGLELGTVENDD
jgi:hypothetical protein